MILLLNVILSWTLIGAIVNLNDPNQCNFVDIYPVDTCSYSFMNSNYEESYQIICDDNGNVTVLYYEAWDCTGTPVANSTFFYDDAVFNCAGSSSCPLVIVSTENCYDENEIAEFTFVINTCAVGQTFDDYMVRCRTDQYFSFNFFVDDACTEDLYNIVFHMDVCNEFAYNHTITSIDCAEDEVVPSTTWSPNDNYTSSYVYTTQDANLNDPDYCNYYSYLPINTCAYSQWNDTMAFSVKIVCEDNEPVQQVYYGNADCSGDHVISQFFGYPPSYNCAGSSSCPWTTITGENCYGAETYSTYRYLRNTCVDANGGSVLLECYDDENVIYRFYPLADCEGMSYNLFNITLGSNCDTIGMNVSSLTCDDPAVTTDTDSTGTDTETTGGETTASSGAASNTLFSVLLCLSVFWFY